MTLSSNLNNIAGDSAKGRLKNEPYMVINLVFAGLIILILLYFLVFSPEKGNYPVPCIHERITGEKCPSCGISHSFSLILRGRINEAYDWNSNGMKVFIFFFAQLLMRIAFTQYYRSFPGSRKELILMDIIGSSTLFLITFMPFIVFFFRWL